MSLVSYIMLFVFLTVTKFFFRGCAEVYLVCQEVLPTGGHQVIRTLPGREEYSRQQPADRPVTDEKHQSEPQRHRK